MMKQFYDLKAKHPDALILFRCGDFYETYAEDAVEAAEILGITLTRRSNGKSAEMAAIQMAGFPHHALDTYLPKLVRAGKRVAICDQLEDPKLAKKLVKRGITEVVTPGIITQDSVLNGKENNFLSAIHFGKKAVGLALLDISTGEFLTAEGPQEEIEKLIGSFAPKELLYERNHRANIYNLTSLGSGFSSLSPSPMEDWVFNEQTARQKLCEHFGVKHLKGFGVDHLHDGLVAAGAILFYLEQTQHNNISHIGAISLIEDSAYVRMDNFTLRSLELINSMNEGGRSLLSVIDKTISPMGGRMLRRWLMFPLKDRSKIEWRHKVVEELYQNRDFRGLLTEQLQSIGDMERIASKIATQRATPRDLVALMGALQAIQEILNFDTQDSPGSNLQALISRLSILSQLKERISREIVPNPPLQAQKGGVIADGVNEELDELRRIAYSGKDYLIQMQQQEIERTGIQSLKIGFNNVFGYYMEVRNTFKDKVPQEWIRKQTLVSAERYITQELKEYEEKILGAEEKILAIESRLFAELLAYTAGFIADIQRDAHILAQIDCLLSFAQCAEQYKYVCPVIDDSMVLDIKAGRHPVIERQMPLGEEYIANDVYLDTERQQIIILTGPNMAGKSALLRQTALITILAQTGSYVPADSARIGIVDKVFTRVGASDNISQGESTFMVEMTEAASILNNITPRSLVLFDELGRGTSTYDGISIAWSIIEYIHENPKAHARTLFATHYHELNEMEKMLPRVKNFNVSVKESNGRVIFMRKLVPGGSEHSFGIHVARLAGMTSSVVNRAEEVLKQLESSPKEQVAGGRKQGEGTQLSFFQLDDPVLCQIRDEILNLDVNNLTPIEALNKLNDIKRIIRGR